MSAVFPISMAVTLVVEAATFVGGVLAARLLLPDGRGYLAAIVLWQMVVLNLGSAGIEDALAYFGARERAGAPRVFGRAVVAFSVLSVALCSVSLSIVYLVFSAGDGGPGSSAMLAILIVPAWLGSAMTLALLRGLHLFGVWNVLRGVNAIGYVGFVLIALSIGYVSVSSFVLALILSHVVVVLAGMVVLARSGVATTNIEFAFPSEVFRYGLKAHTSHVGRFMTTRLDEIVISLMMAPAALGYYVVALTLAKITRPLVQTVADITLPRAAVVGPTRNGLDMFRRHVRLTGAMMITICLPLVALGPWLIAVVFGPTYGEAQTVVVPVILATLPFAGKTMLATGLKAFNHSIVAGKCELSGTMVMAVLAPLAALHYGIVGVAWAATVSHTVAFLMMSRSLNKLFPARWGDLYLPQFGDIAFVCNRAMAWIGKTDSR